MVIASIKRIKKIRSAGVALLYFGKAEYYCGCGKGIDIKGCQPW
jgi:hypothetical protein